MPATVFGRTNVTVPPVWLSLAPPHVPNEGWLDELVGSALEGNCPIDVSGQPGLWGGALRGKEACILTIGDGGISRATEEAHAMHLLQAHLIETLCAVGRETLDYYFLRIRGRLEEYQINGALTALELARQEGHLRYLGICCDGPAMATLAAWQFHDAFEALLIPRNHYDQDDYKALSPLAHERRVGVITSRPLEWGFGLPFTELPSQWRLRNLTQSFYGLTIGQAAISDLAKNNPVLVSVRTPKEVRLALEAVGKTLPEGLDAMLEPFRQAFEDDECWQAMLSAEEPWLKEAAQRRLKLLGRTLSK